jgi:hypothetical protein
VLVDALHQEILQQGVLHADETPVQMLSPGNGKTHRAYLRATDPQGQQHRSIAAASLVVDFDRRLAQLVKARFPAAYWPAH